MSSLFLALLLVLVVRTTAAADAPFIPAAAQRLYADQVADWIFAVPTELQVCDDGHYAAFGRGYWYRTIDLTAHKAVEPIAGTGGSHTIYLSSCTALRTDGHAWKANGASAANALAQALAKSLPQGVLARPSPDGSQLAYFTAGVYWVARPEGQILHLATTGAVRDIDLGEPITGVEWLPDSASLVALIHDPVSGLSTLLRVTKASGKIDVLADGLDGASTPGSIGMTRDGSTVFLSLVGTSRPSNDARNAPFGRRDLDIYAFNVAHRTFKRVVSSPHDDFAPTVVGDSLFWTTGDSHNDVIVLSIQGGRVQNVADGGLISYFAPDDHAVAYTVGDERMADPAINYDNYITDLGPDMKPVGPSRPFIVGPHEDFAPQWSPNGKWLVFHSHRCGSNPPYYLHQGCTDGVYLLRAGDSADKQRLISPPGMTKETGLVDFSRDSRHIAFSAWKTDGTLDIAELSIITIDPDTGAVLGTENLGVPPGLVNARMQYWSPTADELAIEDYRGDVERAIWIMDYKSRKIRKILDFKAPTFVTGLAWTRDGRRLIYSADVDGQLQLFSVAKEGGTPSQISFEQFGSLIMPYVSWDGRWITATRTMTTRELWRVKIGALPTL